MKIEYMKINIRLALLDLGRDPHVKLPDNRAKLETMWNQLRLEQANDPDSKLRDDIKKQIKKKSLNVG